MTLIPDYTLMNTIEQLLVFLAESTPADSIARISLTPSARNLLHLSGMVRTYFFYSGFTDEELGRKTYGCEYISTGKRYFQVNVDPEQRETFRLWDEEGREVMEDRRRSTFVVYNNDLSRIH